MKTAIEIIGNKKCTGCFGCYNVCPVNAIEMKYDEEGFYKPNILENCIECGKCENVCPVIKNENNNKYVKAYGAWSNDKEILLNSSSGGIFSELASKILEENGIVYGVTWENGEVKHKRVEVKEELKDLRGSKYLPSFVGNSYKKVVEDLKNNKKVLFSGTPCQVATLNKIIESDNLITIDLICHGMPSYKVYKKYCSEEFRKNIKKVEFRNKNKGWLNYSLVYYYGNNGIKKIYHDMDKFFCGFLKDIYLNEPCYNCKFKGTKEGKNREADITLADFWGVPEELFNKNGVSLIVTNNKKGQNFFEQIKNKIYFKEVTLEVGIKNNSSFYKSCIRPKERDLFFKNFNEMKFSKLAEKYFNFPSYFKRLKKIIKRNELIKSW